MNKPALKKFAIEARRELLERVELQARKIGITCEGIQKATVESSDAIFIDGRQLKEKERTQRNKLVSRIQEIGFDRVMEEVAYTWFNRFTALRFMEVNDYLPTKVRILSSTNSGSIEPDMMKEALSLDLDLDKEYVYELKLSNNDEELFKYLIIKHCNDLNRYMPFMFETIDDYTEILFPEGLLAAESFIRKMTDINVIPESNWTKIEVIGWLYQYYIAEEKDRVFKAKKKYKSEEIPFATQLFTPEWIVRYMVQNSLGRYWVESNPQDQELVTEWEFYLQNKEDDFEEKIEPYINKDLKVEDIKCFDPAMGSGHILVYMFDVLYEIYSKSGYMEREIPRLIIENNLYGLDIDDRAYQLASFSLIMKAMEYNKRFLRTVEREGLSLNLAAIQETNSFTKEDVEFLVSGIDSERYDEVKIFTEQFRDAKSIGSLIKVEKMDMEFLENRLKYIQTTAVTNLFDIEKREKVLSLIPKIIKQTKVMSLEYDIVVTNPPYMGSGSMSTELYDYLKKNYSDSKGDLFAAFMDIEHYLKNNGFYACINQHSWMFLSSYENLRVKISNKHFIENMLHLGPRAFEEIGGEVVQSTTFVMRNCKVANVNGVYIRLVDMKNSESKRQGALNASKDSIYDYRYVINQNRFSGIPGNQIAYWITPNLERVFLEGQKLSEIAAPRQGVKTLDNNRFLKFWYEVSAGKIGLNITSIENAKASKKKWFPYNKGGSFMKWYGNNEYVVNWENDGEEMKSFAIEKYNSVTRTITNISYFFKKGLTWSALTSGGISLRLFEEGFIFDSKGSSMFFENEKDRLFILALLNSNVSETLLKIMAPTLDFNVGPISNIPVIFGDREKLAEKTLENVEIAKENWDSSELSWDFKIHPLIKFKENSVTIKEAFTRRMNYSKNKLARLKSNEEEINKIIIDIYKLEDEVTPDVKDENISFYVCNFEREIKSFISYAVGCFLGRYSLDKEGIIFAGGALDSSRYLTFSIDDDNIIPILSESYFDDDIATMFINFVQTSYGTDSLEENLVFIAKAIGSKKNETARETVRRYFLNDFYKDHVQLYKKRPIYWLFTSGKEKAFNCLIYMHRYDKTTLSRIRTDYLHEVQIRMDAEKKDLLNIIEGDSTTKEISNAKKELKSLDKKIDELKAYDELLHHMADMQIEIDLDDGVAVNYAKFEGLVAKI